MADGKIYITISDTRESSSPATPPTPAPTPNPAPSPKPKPAQKVVNDDDSNPDSIFNFIYHQFYHFVENQALNMVNYSISNIGNFTGNYISQTNTQQALSAANSIKGIAVSGLAGFKVAGAYGAVAAVAVATGSVLINSSLQNKSNMFANERMNKDISYLRDLSGLDVLTNGSRI